MHMLHGKWCEEQSGIELNLHHFSQLKTEPGLGGVMDGMNVKSLEERSEGDVASPSSTGTQVQPLEVCYPFFHLLN